MATLLAATEDKRLRDVATAEAAAAALDAEEAVAQELFGQLFDEAAAPTEEKEAPGRG